MPKGRAAPAIVSYAAPNLNLKLNLNRTYIYIYIYIYIKIHIYIEQVNTYSVPEGHDLTFSRPLATVMCRPNLAVTKPSKY